MGGTRKHLAKKLRYAASAKRRDAPRWADLKKFGRRARSRRIRVATQKHWRRSRLKL